MTSIIEISVLDQKIAEKDFSGLSFFLDIYQGQAPKDVNKISKWQKELSVIFWIKVVFHHELSTYRTKAKEGGG